MAGETTRASTTEAFTRKAFFELLQNLNPDKMRECVEFERRRNHVDSYLRRGMCAEILLASLGVKDTGYDKRFKELVSTFNVRVATPRPVFPNRRDFIAIQDSPYLYDEYV